jgi:hypothetical protein
MLAMPFYVTLTAQIREFVPAHRLGRAITSLYLFGLSAAFFAQWLTGLLVGVTAEPGRIGSPLGYRLVFAFLALILVAALLIYRRTPEPRGASKPAATTSPPARSGRSTSTSPP